jgi:hypothetical protein
MNSNSAIRLAYRIRPKIGDDPLRGCFIFLGCTFRESLVSPAARRRGDRIMATPVVPSQFAVGKNRIIHKPTAATFSFDTSHTTFKSINWGREDEKARRRTPQGNAELMAKEQVLGFKSARRLEEVDNEHCERMQDREHRPQSCDDSSRRCDSQAGWNFRKGQLTDLLSTPRVQRARPNLIDCGFLKIRSSSRQGPRSAGPSYSPTCGFPRCLCPAG